MTYVNITALTFPEGAGAEIEKRFAARKRGVDTSRGFQSFELLRPVVGEDRYFVRAVDAEGNRSATTAVYTAPAPGQADASNPVLLEANATWNYRAEASAAPENWAQASFDDSA